MTQKEALHQSRVNQLGITVYPVPNGAYYSINIGYHIEQDITNPILIKEIKGSQMYPVKGSKHVEKIRELYKHLYNKNLEKTHLNGHRYKL